MSEGETYILSDDIADIPEDITQKSIVCSETGQRFNFIAQYVDFCKQYKIALPQENHLQRIQKQFLFCSSMVATQMIDSEGTSWIHYYPAVFGYQHILPIEEYDKKMYG